MEGVGCVLTGVFGSGTLMTSFSNNIAVIAVTKASSSSKFTPPDVTDSARPSSCVVLGGVNWL